MIVAIIGSRSFADLDRVREYVRKIAAKYPGATIVSGGAKGVDRAAEQAASVFGLRVVSYRPVEVVDGYAVYCIENGEAGQQGEHVHNTRTLSKYERWAQAAYARNLEIVDAADVVVAFHDGASRGTQHGIDYAKAQGTTLFVNTPTQEVQS